MRRAGCTQGTSAGSSPLLARTTWTLVVEWLPAREGLAFPLGALCRAAREFARSSSLLVFWGRLLMRDLQLQPDLTGRLVAPKGVREHFAGSVARAARALYEEDPTDLLPRLIGDMYPLMYGLHPRRELVREGAWPLLAQWLPVWFPSGSLMSVEDGALFLTAIAQGDAAARVLIDLVDVQALHMLEGELGACLCDAMSKSCAPRHN